MAKKAAPKKLGWFEKEYGGEKKYSSPTTQDTQRHFGRGSAPKPKPIRPFGKGV